METSELMKLKRTDTEGQNIPMWWTTPISKISIYQHLIWVIWWNSKIRQELRKRSPFSEVENRRKLYFNHCVGLGLHFCHKPAKKKSPVATSSAPVKNEKRRMKYIIKYKLDQVKTFKLLGTWTKLNIQSTNGSLSCFSQGEKKERSSAKKLHQEKTNSSQRFILNMLD